MPWYKLLRRDGNFFLSDDHLKSFETLKNDLLQARTTTLRLAKPGQQYVVFVMQIIMVVDFFS